MNNKRIFFYLTPFFFVALFFWAYPAQAVCPVCTVAVGACLGLSRYFGIDDIITSLWIGGLLVSMVIWTIDWLDRKKIKFIFRKILVAVVFYGIVLIPLYRKELVGNPLNKLWGVDKVLLGTLIGSLVFVLAVVFNNFLKRKNDGKVFFPFQKVILPVVFLATFSFIFYFLTC